MDKKLWVVVLVLTFMLGSMSSFWSKPAQANTGPKILLCTAEPWSDDFPGAKNPSPPDTSGLNTTENQVRIQSSQKSSTPNSTDSEITNLSHRFLRTLWGMIFPESL